MGAAPNTKEWDEWLVEAEREVKRGNRAWRAVKRRVELVGGVTAGEREDHVGHDSLATK